MQAFYRRSVTWLLSALLIACIGLAPVRAQENILVYDPDYSCGSYYKRAQYALISLGKSYTLASYYNFNDLLTGSTWDLVVVDCPNCTPGDWGPLIDYIYGGGKVIMCFWDLDNDAGQGDYRLPGAFGVSVSYSFYTPMDTYRWDASHPIFNNPNAVGDLIGWSDYFWNDNGDALTVVDGAAVAGFTTSPADGQAAIVVGNSNRTIYNGFIFDDLNDGDTMINLIANEVQFLLAPFRITLDPATVCEGQSSTGTVTLNDPAPAGGAVVALSSSDTSVAQVPDSVTVAEGEKTASFAISTIAVTSDVNVAINGTYSDRTTGATLKVRPLLASLALNPDTVCEGQSSTGTVTLNCPAPAGGAVVALSSSDTSAAPVPDSVTVAEGETSATFTILTGTVPNDTTASISAGYGGATTSATLTVKAVQLVSFTLNPKTTCGTLTSTGTITLNCPALAGGAVVTLSSSDPSVAPVPGSVTVAEGETTATFTITTGAVASNTSVSVNASYGGVTKTATLTVKPLLVSVQVIPSVIHGGEATTLIVKLACPAQAGGVTVALHSDHKRVAPVPASLTVPEGYIAARATIQTYPVTSWTHVTIKGAYAGATKKAALTLKP